MRRPTAAVALGVAIAVLTAGTVSGPILLDAAGEATFRDRMDALPQRTPAGQGPVVQAVSSASATVPPDSFLTAFDAIPHLADATVQIHPFRFTSDTRADLRPSVSTEGGGEEQRAVVFHHSDAIDTLDVIEHVDDRAGGGGMGDDGEPVGATVWLPDHLADELGVRAGDRIDHQLITYQMGEPVLTVTIAGIYRTEWDEPARARLPVSDEFDWTDLQRQAQLPPDPDDRRRTAALLLAEQDDVFDILAGIGEFPIQIRRAVPDGELGLAEARAATTAIRRLERQMASPTSEIGNDLREVFPEPFITIVTGLPPLALAAEQTAEELRPAVVPVAWAVLSIGLAVTIAAASAHMTRRRSEVRRNVLDGARPIGVGVRLAVEVLPAIATGGLVGWLATQQLVAAVGPGNERALDLPLQAGLTRFALAVLVAVIAVIGTATFRTLAMERTSTGRAEQVARKVPWPALLVLAAVLAGIRVADGATPAQPVDALALAFPVLALAAASWLLLRLVSAVARRLPPGADPRAGSSRAIGRWLARRRLTGSAHELLPVGNVVASTLGVLLYSVLVGTATGTAVEAKVDTMAGAPTTLRIDGAWELVASDGDERRNFETGSPVDLGIGDSMVVWRDRHVSVDPDLAVDLLVVDPATFADVALTPSNLAVDHALSAFGSADEAEPLPAIVAADPARRLSSTDGWLVRGDWWTTSYEVVARTPTFPGVVEGGRPLLVVPADATFARVPEYDPRLEPPSEIPRSSHVSLFTTEVWSTATPDELLPALAARSVTFDADRNPAVTRPEVGQDPVLVAARWATDFLLAAAVGTAALALVAVWAHASRDPRTRALEAAMLGRMGLTRRHQRRLEVVELLVPTVVAIAVGAGIALGLAAVMVPRLDPLTTVTPPMALEVPGWLLVAVTVGTGAVASMIAWVAAHRRGRLSLPEVLRAQD